jgi:hypothetical protein
MLGCEQESLLPEQALADVQSDDFTWSAPIPESVTLTDIRATVINGVLSFATAEDFRVAQHAVAKATDAEYSAWADATSGFFPQFLRYRALVETMENRQTPFSEEDLTKSDKQFIRIDAEGRPTLRYPSLMYARLLNYEGKVLINGDLNLFTEAYHMMIDEADPEKLAIGLATLTSDYSAGIIVEPFQGMDEDPELEDQKVHQANFNCPVIRNSAGGFFADRTDKQTLSGSRQELRSTWLMQVTTLTSNNNTGELTILYETFINFENWRRQGLTWKRTQPNTLGSYFRDSGDVFEVDVIFLDRIQQVFVPGTGNITVASTINATVSRHAAINGAVDILTGGERINGSNGGTYVFDNEMLTGFFTPGTGAQWSMIYSLNDGTASVR